MFPNVLQVDRLSKENVYDQWEMANAFLHTLARREYKPAWCGLRNLIGNFDAISCRGAPVMRKIKLDPSQNNEKYDDLPMLLRDDADQLFDNNAKKKKNLPIYRRV